MDRHTKEFVCRCSQRGLLLVSLISGSLGFPARTALAQTRFRFEAHGPLIFLRAKIADADTLEFLLDSGAQASVLNSRLADRLTTGATSERHVGGTGSRVTSARMTDELAITLPSGDVVNNKLLLLPLDSVEEALGHRIDGILGAPAFTKFVIDMRWSDSTIALYSAGRFARPPSKCLPLELHAGLPTVRATATVANSSVTGDFLIDLGANSIAGIDSTAAAKLSNTMGIPITAVGVGGEVSLMIARLVFLEMGDVRVLSPVVLLGTHRPPTSRIERVGFIGAGLLSRYNSIWDYEDRCLWLTPLPSQPFEANASGLGVISKAPDFRRFIVRRVDADSPAAVAGIQPGDEIISIDGNAASTYLLPDLQRLLRRTGATVELKIRRNSEIITSHLQLQRRV
jgi:hypothetical protein